MQPQGLGPSSRGAWLVTAGLILTAARAYAEPSVGGAHRPILWGIVLVGAGVAAVIPQVVKKVVKTKLPGWVFAVASVVLALLVLGFVGPVFVALGSIVMTGRTM